jgi:hypothetical protein
MAKRTASISSDITELHNQTPTGRRIVAVIDMGVLTGDYVWAFSDQASETPDGFRPLRPLPGGRARRILTVPCCTIRFWASAHFLHCNR